MDGKGVDFAFDAADREAPEIVAQLTDVGFTLEEELAVDAAEQIIPVE